MLRFLFCLVFIAPVFFLPGLLGNQEADASVEIQQDTYDVSTDRKLVALENCESEAIPVYFYDAYVESHSAEFLHSAVEAASNCDSATARVVNLTFKDMNEAEINLSDERVYEVTQFLNAYETSVVFERSAREVELDTPAVNGRAVIVEFNFDRSGTVETLASAATELKL